MSFGHYPRRDTTDLVDLLARRPELRDVGIGDNMYDLDGWTKVSCVDSDELRAGKKPRSSLTDPSGDYSAGVVYTEWATDDERPVLRDYRWTDEARECEHYIPLEES